MSLTRWPLELPPVKPARESWWRVIGGGVVLVALIGLLIVVVELMR